MLRNLALHSQCFVFERKLWIFLCICIMKFMEYIRIHMFWQLFKNIDKEQHGNFFIFIDNYKNKQQCYQAFFRYIELKIFYQETRKLRFIQNLTKILKNLRRKKLYQPSSGKQTVNKLTDCEIRRFLKRHASYRNSKHLIIFDSIY